MSIVAAASRPRIPKDALYQTPAVAWSSVTLFVLALAIWGGALWAVLQGLIPPLLAIALQTVASFMQFTVLHEGVHRSLLRGYPRLNDLMATCAGVFLGAIGTCAAFRYVHFAHHRHTNEPDKDPDMWSGRGAAWRLPLQWATADFRYIVIVLGQWSQLPVKDRIQIVAVTGSLLVGYIGCWFAGYGMEATLYWLIPSRLAILWLAFAFNYLPHHPHNVLQSHNPYAATNARRGGEPWMKWLFLYQNYHIIHHLFPSVPFYRYQRIWAQRKAEFKTMGTPEVAWYQTETAAASDR